MMLPAALRTWLVKCGVHVGVSILLRDKKEPLTLERLLRELVDDGLATEQEVKAGLWPLEVMQRGPFYRNGGNRWGLNEGVTLQRYPFPGPRPRE